MSRPRSSTRASSTPTRGGARTSARPGIYVATPKSDIYVALLSVALGAMVLADILLGTIFYGYDFKVSP